MQNKRKITRIIIHCTATPEGRQVTVEDVDRWHRARGFNSIGYHWLIYLDGSVHAGRSEAEIGAHCRGYNSNSIGVCYVGGLDQNRRPADTRTAAQRQALRQLVAELQRKYPGATVHGHNEFAPKACPCFQVPREL